MKKIGTEEGKYQEIEAIICKSSRDFNSIIEMTGEGGKWEHNLDMKTKEFSTFCVSSLARSRKKGDL